MHWEQRIKNQDYATTLADCTVRFSNVFTFEYKGYSVITFSQRTKGIGYIIFFKDKYCRYRRYDYNFSKGSFNDYIKRFIDDALGRKAKGLDSYGL